MDKIMHEEDFTEYAGIEVHRSWTLTDVTKNALTQYQDKGFVVIECGDGPEGCEVHFAQLIEIAGNVGISYGLIDWNTLVLWDNDLTQHC